MINKEGKLFGKISIIDIVAVLAILAAAFGVYTRFFVGNERVETASSQIEYTMKVAEVRQGTVDALKNFGGPIYDDTTKEYLGEIVDVTYKDAIKGVELLNGDKKESTVPDRFDAIITVRVDGKINQSGFYTNNNQDISAGASKLFNAKAVTTTGTILDVYEVKQ